MSLKLFGFGGDITKVREDIEVNIDLLKSEKIQLALIKKLQYIIDSISEEKKKEYDIYEINTEAYTPFLVNLFFDRLFIPFMVQTSKTPFEINLFSTITLDLLWCLENYDSFEDIYNLALTKRFFLDFNREGDSLRTKLKLFRSDKEKLKEFYLNYSPIKESSDKKYDFYFAITLRQTSVQKIAAFLGYHQSKFEGDFNSFLEYLLIDYSDILPKKTITTVEKWLASLQTKEQESLPLTDKTIFENPPEGYHRIKGLWTDEEVKHFLSFLYIEEDEEHGAFLKKEELDIVMKYGLAVPPENNPTHFQLRFSSKNTRGIFYHAFYLMFSKHCSNQKDKKYIVQFIYRYFPNLGKDEKSINASLRNRVMKKNHIDFNKYLPKK